MTLRPWAWSEATTLASFSKRSMSYTCAFALWSTGGVSCHCQLVFRAGLQIVPVGGVAVGVGVGTGVGTGVGAGVGASVGVAVETGVGAGVGTGVGAGVGASVGVTVEAGV